MAISNVLSPVTPSQSLLHLSYSLVQNLRRTFAAPNPMHRLCMSHGEPLQNSIPCKTVAELMQMAILTYIYIFVVGLVWAVFIFFVFFWFRFRSPLFFPPVISRIDFKDPMNPINAIRWLSFCVSFCFDQSVGQKIQFTAIMGPSNRSKIYNLITQVTVLIVGPNPSCGSSEWAHQRRCKICMDWHKKELWNPLEIMGKKGAAVAGSCTWHALKWRGRSGRPPAGSSSRRRRARGGCKAARSSACRDQQQMTSTWWHSMGYMPGALFRCDKMCTDPQKMIYQMVTCWQWIIHWILDSR